MKTFGLTGLAAAVATVLLGFGAVAWAQPLPLPGGSWRDTCGEARAYFQDGARTLSARCSNSRGGSSYSSLRYDQCRGDIANRDGQLVCGNPGPLPPGAGVPDGSYRRSCRGAYVSGGRLYAECRDHRGDWQRTSIDLASCRGRDITNIDGRLTCSNGGGGQLPPGSWRASCDQAYMSGYTLVAICRDRGGNRVRSSLDIRACNGRDIANYDGRLSCRGGGGGQVPPGSYRASCTNAYMSGFTLNAQCRDRRGYLQRSSIDVRSCRSRDIANHDGRLSCGGRPW